MSFASLTFVVAFLILPAGYLGSRAGPFSNAASFASDSTAALRTVSRFHEALERGDSALIVQLISRDLRVLESGEVETRAQYLAHHLAADMEFARAVRGERIVVSYTQQGMVAWVVSTSTTSGRFDGRDINNVGAELMILSRTRTGWQIRAIHWSSARRPSA